MNRIKRWLLLAPFLCVTALVLSSIWNIIVQGLGYIPAFGLTQPTIAYYAEVFSRPEFLSALHVSLRISLLSSVLAAAFGVLLCWALVSGGHTRGLMLYAIRFPILIPHAVAAVFVINIFSQTGLIARLAYAAGLIADYAQFPQLLYTDGYTGAILAYLWKEIPFVAYFTLALMSSISSTLGEAAENLGASPVRSFFLITLPLCMPTVAKAFLIIFVFSFGGYELPLLLGATLPKALPVQTYLAYINPDLRQRPYAMAMNGVMLLISAAFAVMYALLSDLAVGSDPALGGDGRSATQERSAARERSAVRNSP